MSFKSISVALSALSALMVFGGCSSHQAPPATPAMTGDTPTFRLTANSYDQPNSPKYEQAGQLSGQPATLKPIPTVARFDQNAPLAESVYSALEQGLGPTVVHYITTQSSGETVEIAGTAPSAAIKSQAEQIAKKTPGVKKVIDQIVVQS